MSLIRPSTLLVAGLMASPALYQAFVTQTLDVEVALLRFLIAVPVAMLMLAGLRMITGDHEAQRQRARHEARKEAEVVPPDRSRRP